MAIERLYLQPEQGARLFDRPIQDLQRALAANVSYLTHVFGRCERLVKEVNGQRRYTPNVYRGKDDYILLTPDNRDLGNYAFFVLDEPERFGVFPRMRAPFSLIVWVDMRTFEQNDDRNIFQLEMDILRVVSGHGVLRQGSVSVEMVYHKAENVFEGFTLDEVDNQFLMSPYCGLRLQGELIINEDCITV